MALANSTYHVAISIKTEKGTCADNLEEDNAKLYQLHVEYVQFRYMRNTCIHVEIAYMSIVSHAEMDVGITAIL
eukprot:1158373-Pelagomonas_calceolata.AAC.1